MNAQADLTQTQSRQRNMNDLAIYWTVLPTPLQLTYDELMGNLEEDIYRQAVAADFEPEPMPETDADDFETAYVWFIA
jgi:hypothetical protein